MNIEAKLSNKLKRLAIEWVFAEYPQLHFSASDEEYALEFDKIMAHSSDLDSSYYVIRDIYDFHNLIQIALENIYNCMIETMYTIKLEIE